MTYLPDVNVWLALTHDRHIHHTSAAAWISTVQDPIVFCRITQMGFLRLLTNRSVMAGDVLSVEAAWQTLAEIRRDDRVSFAEEPPALEHAWQQITRHQLAGSSFLTDAYLSAFAETGGFTLVTFDKAFRSDEARSVRILS